VAQIARAVVGGEPLVFTLPAFPCKSPNPEKVLGPWPDLGERLSLRFLDGLCREVEELYPPGARMLVCSDGHVFADLVGVADEVVSAYSAGLHEILTGDGLHRVELVGLDRFYPGESFTERRRLLVDRYAESLAALRDEVRSGDAVHLYRGITRFLVEDAGPGHGLTRSALLRQSRQRAYGVIQRSRAWSALLTERYPDSVRLSIHPQPCRTEKMGIRLLDTDDSWLTPWHGVVLRTPDGRHLLRKRRDAELAGALVVLNGRPSHYVARA
jgi:pyoverdine/dityrosine biosynthesis protein Dit1